MIINNTIISYTQRTVTNGKRSDKKKKLKF